MRWLRLPLALGLLWAIWFGLPVHAWKIPDDVHVIRATSELAALPEDSKLLLEGKLWPDGAVTRLHDGAFLYERRVHYKARDNARHTSIFEAEKPASRLHFADGSELRLPGSTYRRIARKEERSSQHAIHDLPWPEELTAPLTPATQDHLLPAKDDWELRLAGELIARRADESWTDSVSAKGVRAGDDVMVHARLEGRGAARRVHILTVDRGPLTVHAADMARQNRRVFWLGLFLRSFFSLIPLGILSGLWKRPGRANTEDATPPSAHEYRDERHS